MNSLRRYFVAGLATLFPVAVTFLVVIKLFQFSEGWAHRLFGFTVPGIGLLITVSIILAVGFLYLNFRAFRKKQRVKSSP